MLLSAPSLRGTVAVAVATLLPVGCTEPLKPIAVATLAVSRARVPQGAAVDVSIQFDVSPALEPLREDHRAILHAFDGNGGLLWTIDHEPPVPTSAWQPGRSIRYTERVRIPTYPYVGPVVLAIALHAPRSGTRLPLVGNDLGDFVYAAATLTLEQRSESSFIAYDDGWHALESTGDGRVTWRWTTERAAFSFRNPRRPAKLLLEVQARPRVFDRPQSLSLVVGNRQLREETLGTDAVVHLDYALTQDDLGDHDVVRMELRIDPTFVPAEVTGGSDTRTLGVRVLDVYVEPLEAPAL